MLSASFSALLGASSAMAQADAAKTSSSESEAPATHLSNDREAARAAFERGLSLVRETRYAEAKAAFLEAYRAHPHYLVLYNVAQADVQLGNVESAVTYLERFLREGAGVLSAERQRQVNDQVEELRERLSVERSATENGATDPAALADAPSNERPEVAQPQQAPAPTLQSPEPPPLPPPSMPEGVGGSAARASMPSVAPGRPAPDLGVDRPWGVLLGATGIALLGVATGLYVWNDSRHDQWEQERQTLNAIPDRDQALASDLELWQQAKANNDLLESIERVDVVTVVAASVGAVALGAGAWDLLASTPTPAIVASGAVLNWRSSW